jgi:hypothetical protein
MIRVTNSGSLCSGPPPRGQIVQTGRPHALPGLPLIDGAVVAKVYLKLSQVFTRPPIHRTRYSNGFMLTIKCPRVL